jgi:hypothetical protein
MDMDVSQRLRAARIQAGYVRREDLTADRRLPRFGARVLGQIERGERVLYPHEADELARVLAVEPHWLLHGAIPPAGFEEINIKLDLILEHFGISPAAAFSEAIAAGAASANGSGRHSRPARGTVGQRSRQTA